MMRMTFSFPDELANRFLASAPSRQRSATLARLLEQELETRRQQMIASCIAANADEVLTAEMEEWQGFDDPVEKD